MGYPDDLGYATFITDCGDSFDSFLRVPNDDVHPCEDPAGAPPPGVSAR